MTNTGTGGTYSACLYKVAVSAVHAGRGSGGSSKGWLDAEDGLMRRPRQGGGGSGSNSYSQLPAGPHEEDQGTSSIPLSSSSLPKSDDDGMIETHIPSLALITFLGLALNMEYSILMPTVWGYISSIPGGDKLYLGYALSSFSVSRIAFFSIIGCWTDRRPMREVFVVTCFLGIVGNALYGLAGRCQALWLILAARMLTGAGATNAVTSRAYLARVTTARKRTIAIAAQNGVQFLGVMIGPALNLLFGLMDWRIGPYVEINEYTAAGYFMVIPNLVCMIGFIFFFKEPPPQVPPPPPSSTHHDEERHSGHRKKEHPSSSSITTTIVGGSSSSSSSTGSPLWRMLWSRGGWWCLLTAFMTTFNLAALETAITPITQTHFHWGTMANSYLFSSLAVAAVAAIIFTLVLGKKGRHDREIMLYGLAVLLVSFAVDLYGCGDGVHVAMWAVVAGGIMLAFGLIAIANPNASLFTKLIGDGGGSQGAHGSLIFLSTATGRCLGPLAAGFCLSESISKTYYPLYGVLLGLTLLSACTLPCLWSGFGRIERESLEAAAMTRTTVEEVVGNTVGTAGDVFGAAEEMVLEGAEDGVEEGGEDGEGDTSLTEPLLINHSGAVGSGEGGLPK